MDTGEPSAVDLVMTFLKGQNLEQLGKVDEAVAHIYAHRAQHADVVRVGSAALESVHTHEDKLRWYEQMRAQATRAASAVPPAAPKRNG
jgi:hypothetical protein